MFFPSYHWPCPVLSKHWRSTTPSCFLTDSFRMYSQPSLLLPLHLLSFSLLPSFLPVLCAASRFPLPTSYSSPAYSSLSFTQTLMETSTS